MKKIYVLALIGLMSGMSYGAEVFIRVLRPGTHLAMAYNQTQTNNTNTFRFFDLPGGTINLQITDQFNGGTVYSGSVYLAMNQRLVAEIDQFGNFKQVQLITVVTSNWYTSTPETVVYNPNPGGGFGNGTIGVGYDNSFQQFLTAVENESFDSKRLDMMKKYADKTQLSAQQIADLNKKFTFDSYRLDWSKYAYAKCYDKANYFLLKSTFDYISNYSALEEYIEGQ